MLCRCAYAASTSGAAEASWRCQTLSRLEAVGALASERTFSIAAEDGKHLGIEVLGKPSFSTGREQPAEGAPPSRVGHDLRAGGSVDNGGAHSPASVRISRSAFAGVDDLRAWFASGEELAD
jgi:hypothetical protein